MEGRAKALASGSIRGGGDGDADDRPASLSLLPSASGTGRRTPGTAIGESCICTLGRGTLPAALHPVIRIPPSLFVLPWVRFGSTADELLVSKRPLKFLDRVIPSPPPPPPPTSPLVIDRAPHCARALRFEIGDKNTMVLLPKNGLKLLVFLARERPVDGGVDGAPFNPNVGNILFVSLSRRRPLLSPPIRPCAIGETGGERWRRGIAPCSRSRTRSRPDPRSAITDDRPRGVGVKLVLVARVGEDTMDDSGEESPLDLARAMAGGGANVEVNNSSACSRGTGLIFGESDAAPPVGGDEKNGPMRSAVPVGPTALLGLLPLADESGGAEDLSNAGTHTGEVMGVV